MPDARKFYLLICTLPGSEAELFAAVGQVVRPTFVTPNEGFPYIDRKEKKKRESGINESGEICACDKRSGVPISASPPANHGSRYEGCTSQLLRRSTKCTRRFGDRGRVSVRSEIIHPRHKIKGNQRTTECARHTSTTGTNYKCCPQHFDKIEES